MSGSAIEERTRSALRHAADELAAAGAPSESVEQIRSLERQVGQPCVVAVVGRVNAGKSTFINALLGDDRAVVGSTETTATINHFVYGRPDPERPVRCFWRTGHVTGESSDFLDSLQGHDARALERAEAIDRLEYLLRTPLLRDVTLVDTPGTGAVVAEHESRTAQFLAIAQRLRERHDAETAQIHESADAVIYLVGAVARTGDQEVLEQFAGRGAVRARAMNTLGVIAKVDLSPELLLLRHELAGKIASQLEGELSSVVPVSAGLERAAARLSEDAGRLLEQLVRLVRRVPPEQRNLLLKDEELFTAYDPADCPVPASERRTLRETVGGEWRVFATIVEAVGESGGAAEVAGRLRALAGFDELHRILEEQFFARAEILRCFRIAEDARRIVRGVRFGELNRVRRSERDDRARLDRFLPFLEAAEGDEQVASELQSYLQTQLGRSGGADRLGASVDAAERMLGALLRGLGELSADYAALQELEADGAAFTPDEADELRALLGLYGTDTALRLRGDVDYGRCVERQILWRVIRDQAGRGTVRQTVADRAHSRLGLILEELADSAG